MPRDFLNQGVHIADLSVAAGAVPEAAPTLVTHGYPTAQRMGSGVNVDLPLVLVIIDIVGGVTPTADLNLYGYAQPPVAGATLASDWQLIDTVTVSDAVGASPTFALLPCTGFLRFDVKVGAIAGAPTSVSLRLIGISQYAADVLIASGAVAGISNNVNIVQVGTINVPVGNIAGTLLIEGTSADNDPHDGAYPIGVGGKVSAADPTYHAADKGELSIDLAGRLRTNNNIAQINGNVPASIGVNGGLFVGGDVPDGTTASASYPVKMGAVAEFVPAGTGIADDEVTHLITDFQRYLRTVPKAFSELTSADQVENLNTAATDHGYFLIANETNIPQPATQYFPNSSGIVIGSRVNITILLLLEDITSVAFEFTNDPTLTSWEDITASIMDPNTGAALYAPSHWTEPGITPIVMAMHIRGLNAGSFRLAVVGSAAANTFAAHGYSGAL